MQVFRDNKNLRNDNKEIYHRIINFISVNKYRIYKNKKAYKRARLIAFSYIVGGEKLFRLVVNIF